MQLNKFFLLRIIFIISLSSCSLLSNEIAKKIKLPAVENQFVPSIIWTVPIGNGINNFYSNLKPAYSNKVVYSADRKGIIKAIDVNSGKEIWIKDLSKKNKRFSSIPILFSGGITASEKYIYIGTERAQLYAIDAHNGSTIWQTNVAGEVLSHPIVNEGLVLIHTSNGRLQALNEINGMVKWTTNIDVPKISLRGESSPAVTWGIAIIGDDSGFITAILMQNGQILWKQNICQISTTEQVGINHLNDIDATPIIINNIVYALAYNGNLVAIDIYSGQIIWKYKIGSIKNFVVNNNKIYISDQNGCIQAISIDKRKLIWIQNSLIHRLLTAPTFYKNKLVVGDSDGYIHWINPQNGHFLARQKVNSSGFLTDPVVAGNKLLIQANNGVLYAFAC